MTVYVDDTFNYGRKGLWCHCWTDGDIEELHKLGDQIGLKHEWLQRSVGISGEFVHYDLRPSKRTKAIAAGASYMPLRDWVKICLSKKTPDSSDTIKEA